MARANGTMHAVAATRRGVSSPATAVSTSTGSHAAVGTADGLGHLLLSYGTTCLLRCESAGLRGLAARETSKGPVYPLGVPTERRELYGHVVRLLWVEKETLTVEELGERLAAVGVADSRGRPLGDATLRLELAEMTQRLLLPMVYDAGKGDGRKGFRAARSYADGMAGHESLTGRPRSLRETAELMVSNSPSWLASRELPASMPSGQQRVVHALVGALDNGRRLTNGELALVFQQDGLSTSDWRERGRGGAIAGATMREVVKVARRAGVGVGGNSQDGYYLEDVKVIAKSLTERAEAVETHAVALYAACAFHWPQTEKHQSFRAGVLTAKDGVPTLPWSAEYLRRQSAAHESAKNRSDDRKAAKRVTLELHRDMARTRMAEMKEDGVEETLRSRARGASLTAHQNARADEYLAASVFLSKGKPPKSEYAWAPTRKVTTANPRPRVSAPAPASAVEPAPWLR
jgi:hypothetical protein